MQGKIVGALLILISASGCGSGLETRTRGPSTDGTFGYDLHYVMTPEEARARMDAVPAGVPLAEIARVGARAVRWADVLQQDIPAEQREQLWRRIDKIGKEPTPAKPMQYNPEIIRAKFAEGLAAAPAGVEAVIHADDALPAAVPAGTTLTDVIGAIRTINLAYSRASRWLALYEWKDSMRQDQRDFRPWLTLQAGLKTLTEQANDWDHRTHAEREAWIAAVRGACGIAGRVGYCRSGSDELLGSGTGAKARTWLRDVFEAGRVRYASLFTVRVPHPGVRVQHEGAALRLTFFTLGIPADILSWIQEQVDIGFGFAEHAAPLALRLEPVTSQVLGAVKVQWQAGALPHVNGLGGDTIVMDANTAQWLEQTRVTMSHEFGHVIGFPDCYVEFWDDANEQFVFYSLDADDRMCALSGSTLDRHHAALFEAFGR